MDPENREFLVFRSRCYNAEAMTEPAIADAQAAIEIDPNHYAGYYCRAEALFFNGEPELALIDYYRCVKIRPDIKEH